MFNDEIFIFSFLMNQTFLNICRVLVLFTSADSPQNINKLTENLFHFFSLKVFNVIVNVKNSLVIYMASLHYCELFNKYIAMELRESISKITCVLDVVSNVSKLKKNILSKFSPNSFEFSFSSKAVLTKSCHSNLNEKLSFAVQVINVIVIIRWNKVRIMIVL